MDKHLTAQANDKLKQNLLLQDAASPSEAAASEYAKQEQPKMYQSCDSPPLPEWLESTLLSSNSKVVFGNQAEAKMHHLTVSECLRSLEGK